MSIENNGGMRRLILLRHGHAERDAARDEWRNLTEQGRAEAAAVAQVIAVGLARPTRVVSSPYVRARQTADIVHAGLSLPGQVTEVPGITPDDAPSRAIQLLEVLTQSGEIPLVVTHMPLIGALVGVLCNGHASSGPGISTGSGVLLEGERVAPGQMRVVRELLPVSGRGE